MTQDIMKVSVKVAQIETRLDGIEKKVDGIDGINKQMTSVLISLDRLTNKVDEVDKRTMKLFSRLDTLEKAPLGRWEKIKIAAISSLVGSIIGVLVSAFTKILGG